MLVLYLQYIQYSLYGIYSTGMYNMSISSHILILDS
jgi:hypothetical protein